MRFAASLVQNNVVVLQVAGEYFVAGDSSWSGNFALENANQFSFGFYDLVFDDGRSAKIKVARMNVTRSDGPQALFDGIGNPP